MPPRAATRERQEALLRLLRAGTSSVEDLAAAVDVSPSTVRRDLADLTSEGQVARTYGGAVLPEAFRERPIFEAARVRRREKAAIAARALPMVPDAGTVFLDAGTTCGALAALLAPREELTVVTRGLEAALVLAGSGVAVVMLGGSVRHLSHGIVGPFSNLVLDRLSFDVAFLGADAVDLVRGVGEPTAQETAVKERAASRAGRVVVLADSTKLDPVRLPAWAPLPRGWTLVSDDEADGAAVALARAQGVDLHLASVGTPR